MDILKGHKSKIFAAVFIAIIGVGFGVIPYFSVAAIINNLVAKNTNLNNYYPYIFAVFLGFLASILFHEISTIISHNLAYRIIEDRAADSGLNLWWKHLIKWKNRLLM